MIEKKTQADARVALKILQIVEQRRKRKKQQGKKLKKKPIKLANQLVGPFNKIQLMVYQKVVSKSDF